MGRLARNPRFSFRSHSFENTQDQNMKLRESSNTDIFRTQSNIYDGDFCENS